MVKCPRLFFAVQVCELSYEGVDIGVLIDAQDPRPSKSRSSLRKRTSRISLFPRLNEATS